jgi:hypothetical protein
MSDNAQVSEQAGQPASPAHEPAPKSVLIRVGTSLANLVRRHLESSGESDRLSHRLDQARRNWDTIAGSRHGDDSVTGDDQEMTVLEVKISRLEQLLSERDTQNNSLQVLVLKQQAVLKDVLGVLGVRHSAEVSALVERITALQENVTPVPEPVEWYDMVDLLAYEPGAQYVLLAGDEHHLCTEVEKQHADEPRWFRCNFSGNMLAAADAEAWRPHGVHRPPVGWEPCSPRWLKDGGDCGKAPRWYDGKIGNHYHPPVADNAPGAVPGPHKHFPVEFGPSADRKLHCACGDPDPSHADIGSQ